MRSKSWWYHTLNGLWSRIPWCCIKFWNAGNDGLSRKTADPLSSVAQYVRCDHCVKHGRMVAIRFNGRILKWLLESGGAWYDADNAFVEVNDD